MFGYEMLIFAMMHADQPGVPIHLKKLEPELESVFSLGQQIDERTGVVRARTHALAHASAAIRDSAADNQGHVRDLRIAGEDAAWDAFLAWAPSKRWSLTVAFVDLGNIVIADNQRGVYASLQVGF